MDNVTEVEKKERELNEIEKKIEYFFKLTKQGIDEAKNNFENPCMWYSEDIEELTLYDYDQDQVYTVPIKELLNQNGKDNNKGYILDITNLLAKYIKTSVELLKIFGREEK